jgi:hypothetical protein
MLFHKKLLKHLRVDSLENKHHNNNNKNHNNNNKNHNNKIIKIIKINHKEVNHNLTIIIINNIINMVEIRILIIIIMVEINIIMVEIRILIKVEITLIKVEMVDTLIKIKISKKEIDYLMFIKSFIYFYYFFSSFININLHRASLKS